MSDWRDVRMSAFNHCFLRGTAELFLIYTNHSLHHDFYIENLIYPFNGFLTVLIPELWSFNTLY